MNHLTLIRVISAMFFLTGIIFSQDRIAVYDSPHLPKNLALKMPITPALLIQTDESSTRRWITISMGDLDSSLTPLRPNYVADGNLGSFSVELEGFDLNAYLEPKWQRIYGKYPLQYEVEFVDSLRIKIKGRTLPFISMECSYLFNRNEYRIEFIYQDRTLTGFSLSSHEIQKIDSAFGGTSQGSAKRAFENSQGLRSARLKPLLYNSLYIAGGAIALVFAVLISIMILKKMKARKIDPNFADMLDTKTPPILEQTPPVVDEPEILTPEMREEKIRSLMASDSISYDEAALRVQYESLN